MVNIENIGNKIKDSLNKNVLIPKEDLIQFLEYTKKKISSIFFDFIFKNDLEIYKYDEDNIKDIIKEIIDKTNIDNKLLSSLDKYKTFSIQYADRILIIIKSFSDNLFNSVFFNYYYKIFMKEQVIEINNLFHNTYSKECLTFIRQVSDLRDSNFSYLNSVVNLIYNYFQNIFRYSRRLMIYMFVDTVNFCVIFMSLKMGQK